MKITDEFPRNLAVCRVLKLLTHWGRQAHICVGNLTIIGSDNGLSPGRRQAIILTNAGILLIGHLGINFSGILFEIQTFPFKEMRLKLSSAKWRPFCLGLIVLTDLSVIHLGPCGCITQKNVLRGTSVQFTSLWLHCHSVHSLFTYWQDA